VNLAALDARELADPRIRALITVLTSGPSQQEVAGQDAALAMFRAEQSRPHAAPTAAVTFLGPAPAVTRVGRHRQPQRRIWLSGRLAAGAATLVATAFLAAGYAAALPAPLQHAAYSILGFVGMPDSHGGTRPHASPAPPSGPASTAPGHTGSPGNGHTPGRPWASHSPGSHGQSGACQYGTCGRRNGPAGQNSGKHKHRQRRRRKHGQIPLPGWPR
jgi:hypothetical protein